MAVFPVFASEFRHSGEHLRELPLPNGLTFIDLISVLCALRSYRKTNTARSHSRALQGRIFLFISWIFLLTEMFGTNQVMFSKKKYRLKLSVIASMLLTSIPENPYTLRDEFGDVC